MESFERLLVCTTNSLDGLDEAALRRFDFKVGFRYLDANQRVGFFLRTLVLLGADETALKEEAQACNVLARLSNLASGDFAAVRERLEALGEPVRPADLAAALERECRLKRDGRARIGFAP